MTGVEVALTVGATARLTRLVGADTITEPLRAVTVGLAARVWAPAGFFLAALLSCHWCLSVWMAAATVAGWWLLPGPVWMSATLVLTAAYAAGWLADREADDDE